MRGPAIMQITQTPQVLFQWSSLDCIYVYVYSEYSTQEVCGGVVWQPAVTIIAEYENVKNN